MPVLHERYGYGSKRIAFGTSWTDDSQWPFEHEERETFSLLRCPRDVPYAWVKKRISFDPARPFVLATKIRCRSEERGPHFIVGVQSKGRGGFLLRQGGRAFSWNNLGAFGPDGPHRSLAGFNTNDWHVFTLRVAPGWRNCAIFYDTEEVLTFPTPWGTADEDVILIGCEHPTQDIWVDWVWAGEAQPPLNSLYLPTLFPVDWQMDGAMLEMNAVQRHPANPVLSPGGADSHDARSVWDVWTMRDGNGYRMWYTAANSRDPNAPCAMYHATSPDGVRWQKTSSGPVLPPGQPGEWDDGGVQSPVVVKDETGYSMWYAGYLHGYREARTGIARSPDGIRWEKVRVGKFPFRGSLDNNIVYPLQDTLYDNQYTMPQCVLIDEDAPPERRYVLFVHAQGRNGIIGVAYSCDGKAFYKDDMNARYHGVDEQGPEVGRLHQRTGVIHRDGCWFAFFGYVLRPPHVTTVGLQTYFTAWRDEATDGDNPSFGAWRATLQLDTRPGTWEGQFVFSTCIFEDGDEWKLYYSGSSGGSTHEVGLATVGRDRLWYMRLQPGVAGNKAISRPIRRPPGGWRSYTLTVNASSLHSSGALRLALLDPLTQQPVPGYSWEEAAPITEDGFQAAAGWQLAGALLPDVDGDLCIGVALEGSARLHALRLHR